jgi:hypothetical protein
VEKEDPGEDEDTDDGDHGDTRAYLSLQERVSPFDGCGEWRRIRRIACIVGLGMEVLSLPSDRDPQT